MLKVKVLSFPYRVRDVNPQNPDEEVWLMRDAVLDEELDEDDLHPYDIERGERLGAFYTDEELTNPTSEVVVSGKEPIEMSNEELAEYIGGANPKGKRLTIQETVDLSGGDVGFAEDILVAENILTENDPRAGVVAGLQEVIARGAQ
jgi:hypothetical protein